ncbi:hypothetical protein RUND412_009918 [Rhizina undulata]
MTTSAATSAREDATTPLPTETALVREVFAASTPEPIFATLKNWYRSYHPVQQLLEDRRISVNLVPKIPITGSYGLKGF